MMQTEASRLTTEDRAYLEQQIKELENEISESTERTKRKNLLIDEKIKELRRLRRLRA